MPCHRPVAGHTCAEGDRSLPAPSHYPVMDPLIYARFKSFIEERLGIKMPNAKKTMLQTRLLKRMRVNGMRSFKQYCHYVFSSEGQREELQHMIDVVTTNKTDFFREPVHFTYLTGTAIPNLKTEGRMPPGKPLHLWSAGCSTGAEPYTLAMVLSRDAADSTTFEYSILATDVSRRVLSTAAQAIYHEAQVATIDWPLKKQYLLRSKDRRQRLVRMAPSIRKKVVFRQLNLMDDHFGIAHPMQVIFCRNVMIYFDRKTQQRVLRKLCSHLMEGGYLFIGHSETLTGMNVPLAPAAPTIYRRIAS